jgi:diacylglycerol kinase (ATP)
MLVIVNPAAGRGTGHRLTEPIARRLGALGVRAHVQQAPGPGTIAALVANALGAGERQVVIAGGDGSINEAVNGFVGHAADGQSLGLIPVGTGNDFAKALGVPRHWAAACARLAAPQIRHIDAGRCNGRWFANGMGVGLDADIARAAARSRRLRGPLTYAWGLVQVLAAHRGAVRGVIRHPLGEYAGPVTLAAVMNGRIIGGLFPMAPEADPADGALDLVVGGDLDRRCILTLLPRLLAGRHLQQPGVTAATVTSVTMSFEEPMPLQLDGELPDQPVREVQVTVAPGVLPMLV